MNINFIVIFNSKYICFVTNNAILIDTNLKNDFNE